MSNLCFLIIVELVIFQLLQQQIFMVAYPKLLHLFLSLSCWTNQCDHD